MPQFILNATGPSFATDFVVGYVEAMFFTNCNSGHEDENKANELGTGQLTKESHARIEADCLDFLARKMPNGETVAECIVRQSDYCEVQGGHDFWFTRQGHGVGY